MTDRPAETFADDAGRYRLEERLATGGMGEVWRATDTSLGREVAVKLLKQEYADDPSFRARFGREIEAAREKRAQRKLAGAREASACQANGFEGRCE